MVRRKSTGPNVSSPFAQQTICLLFLAIFSVTTCFAQQQSRPKPELVTDRPDQTESSVVVPPGYVQIETGWLVSRDEEGGIRTTTHEFPGTLFRIGALPRVELRLGWSGGIWERTSQGGQKTDLSGPADMDIGAKLYLWGERGWFPETALLGGVSLPVGKEELSSRREDPSFRLNMSHTLSESFSFGYNLGATWESEFDEADNRTTRSLFNYTAVIGIAVAPRTGLFIEAFGDIPFNGNGGPENSLDGGLTYLVRDNLQLDAAVGVGLSDDADDWFVGLGVTVRFPR